MANSAEYQRAWRKKNPAKTAEYNRKARYGVTREQYEAALKKQKGRCGICRNPPPPRRRLAVDHCHKTHRIRGLLCFKCNTGIGKLGDTAAKVARAVRYLKRR